MLRNRHLERVSNLFADQFELSGHGFLYRKSMKGAPIPVSLAERDRFAADFRRRLRKLMWFLAPSVIAVIVALALLAPDGGFQRNSVTPYAVTGVLIAPYVVLFYWLWNAPARQLKDRLAIGDSRSRAEVRRIMLRKLTYGQLLLGFAMIGLMVLKASESFDIKHGWGLVVPVFAVLLALVIMSRMVKKWQMGEG